MTIVASDDFESYADTAALEAVWTALGGVHDYNHVTLSWDGGNAVVDVNTAYSANYGFSRVFDTGDGILANTTYTITATATGTGECTNAVVSGGPDEGHTGSTTFGAAGTKSFSITATSNADGELYVFIGFGFTPTGYWDYVATMSFAEVSIDDGAPALVFTSGLPIRGVDWDQIAYTAGVITIGGVVFGVTRGGLRFDPGETWEPLPYDGDFIAPVGVHELTGQKPRFIGSFLPVGPRHLVRYLPKSTPSPVEGTTTITPTVPGTMLVTGDYTPNVAVTWPYLSGGTITVTFPYAFWQRYEFNPENKGEMLIPCEILGVPLTSAAAPYYITVVEPGTLGLS